MAKYTSVGHMLRARIAETPSKDAFYSPTEDGWRTYTWKDVETHVEPLAAGLRSLGVVNGDRVALLCSTRVEWLFADLATNLAGCATTTIYPSSTTEDTHYITADSGAVVVFAENDEQVLKFTQMRDQLGTVKVVINIDGAASEDGWVKTLADVVDQGKIWLSSHPNGLQEILDELSPEDIATLIYTSGTTGTPKGVVLVHDCWSFIAEGLQEAGVMQPEDVQYLWLPMSHVFGKMLEVAVLAVGIPTAIDGRIPKLIDNLADIKPTFMAAAPRIFEKVYNKIILGAQQAGGLKYRIFKWAVTIGKQVSTLRQNGQAPQGLLALKFAVADRLVFSKIRAKFGGRIRCFISGSAPLNRDIAEFFHGAGLLILEGYGLTESSAASFVNHPEQNRFGTVGVPMPGTDLQIADDGEILIKSRGVMRGYFNKPEATAETLVDGWLHTGDIGEVDSAGHLRITDRKKALIKTSGGKYVAPSKVEGEFKAICPVVSQILVHGDRRNFCSALVTMDEEAMAEWSHANQIGGGPQEWSTDPKVIALFQASFDQMNLRLGSWETIKKFVVLPNDFTPENGLLTPSLKVRRKAVETQFSAELDALYSDAMVTA
jgi:long-chain acyl-CoA synthetase